MRRGRRGKAVGEARPLLEELIDQLASALDEGRVDLVSVNQRLRWLLAVLETSSGRRLFAKIATSDGREGADTTRPRLVSVSSRHQRLRSEASALRRLHEAVPADDPHLAAVSVVHWQESPPALVVDWVDGRPLSRAVTLLGRRNGRSPSELFRLAGRWLRLFHSLAGDEPAAYRYPEDVLKWLASVDHFLGRAPGGVACRVLVDELAAAIERLEVQPAFGLHHGDMAARNLMVRDDGRLVGVDAGVTWQAPRAHDLGVFVSDLHLRSMPEGRGHRRGDEFLAAYGAFAQEERVTDLFFAVAVVDRYVAWQARSEQAGPRVRWRAEGTRLNRLARRAAGHVRRL